MAENQTLTAEQRSKIIAVLDPFQPAFVYLFGSFGTGNPHESSDIDLAFFSKSTVDPLTCFTLSQNLASALGREVDLVDLSTASTVMAKEVIRTGIVIAEARSAMRQNFEMRTLSDYARLNEERRPVLANFPHD